MLLQSLNTFCKSAGGAGSIRKYIEPLARTPGVSGRFVYGFGTKLHFVDA